MDADSDRMCRAQSESIGRPREASACVIDSDRVSLLSMVIVLLPPVCMNLKSYRSRLRRLHTKRLITLRQMSSALGIESTR